MKNCSFLHHWFLLLKSFCLRSNIKHSTQCFITRWNTSKFVKNTPLRVVFSTLFSVFHLVMKHCVSCLIYYSRTHPTAKVRPRLELCRSKEWTRTRHEGVGQLDSWIQSYLTTNRCESVMNVPYSSHWGGVWEEQIRTTRSIRSSGQSYSTDFCSQRL